MLAQLYRFNDVWGVAVQLQSDGQMTIDICQLTVKNSQISIEKKVLGLTSLGDLQKHIPAKAIIALNISGKGVLAKQVEKMGDIDAGNFSKLLPNAVFEDFYTQSADSGEYSFVTLIRKQDADQWFAQLMKLGYRPVALSLGPFAASNMLDELNVYGDEVIFNGHVVARNEQKDWQNYRYEAGAKAAFKLKLQNEPIDEALVLPYAAAFQLILSDKLDPVVAAAYTFQQRLKEARVNIRFKVQGALVLGVFFVLLLVNFIALSWLDSSNAQLLSKVNWSAQSAGEVKRNAEEIKEKELTLKVLGWDGNNSKSALVDQIAAILPADVKWTAVEVNPLSYESQQTKSLVFLNNTIKISGLSDKVLSVNEWVARIKTKPWVKSVKLENYAFNNELNTGSFLLNITY